MIRTPTMRFLEASRLGDLVTLREMVADESGHINSKVWGLTPLTIAVQSNQIEVIRFFLTEKADVNIHGQHGDTPLHAASRDGMLEAIQVLVREGGADLRATNDQGKKPIEVSKNAEVTELLTILENEIEILVKCAAKLE